MPEEPIIECNNEEKLVEKPKRPPTPPSQPKEPIAAKTTDSATTINMKEDIGATVKKVESKPLELEPTLVQQSLLN